MPENWTKTLKRVSRRYSSCYWFAAQVFQYFESNKLQNLRVLEDEVLIDYLVKHKKSLIRWGDGESAVLYGNDLMFQDFDPMLKKEMLFILTDHKNNPSFILGINHQFICFSLKDYKKQSKKRQKMWRVTRYVMHKFCSLKSVYGDTLLFRPYSNVENKDFEKLWGGKHVVLISSESDHADKILNRTHAKSVHQIKIPSKNSYNIIDNVMDRTLKLINELSYDRNEIRVLISGGPAGKVLAHRLILMDCIVYDVGHYFTWKIDGKTNEKGI